MGRKQKNKKRGVTLTLSEFNEDSGGVDPEILSLPSAPKAPEEWEALGGKPEYNLRGYRERTPGGPSRGGGLGSRMGGGGDYGGEGDDFDDRDWTRRGPLDTEDGGQRGERNWGDMRRNQSVHEEDNERDWNDMRRGPVQSSFGLAGDAGAEERDWTQRRGPMEASKNNQQFPQQEADWSVARGGNVVEAKFDEGVDAVQERDWSQRKGPVKAQQEQEDWSLRKGPVEAQQGQGQPQYDDQDWAAPRKGPIESEFVEAPKPVEERNWSERRGPVEAAGKIEGGPGDGNSNNANQELDWSERRGPVEAAQPVQEQLPLKPNTIVKPPLFDDDDDDDQDWAAVRSTAIPVSTSIPQNPDTVPESEPAATRETGPATEDDGRSEWTRRGPVQSKAEVEEQQNRADVENRDRGDRGFLGRHRRGGGPGSFGRNMSESEHADGSQNEQYGSVSGNWRRDFGNGTGSRGVGRRGRGAFHHHNRPQSSVHDGTGGGFGHTNSGSGERGQEHERDWGAARRSVPEGRNAHSGVAATDEGTIEQNERVPQVKAVEKIGSGALEENVEGTQQEGRGGTVREDDSWTTVRSTPRRDPRGSRRGISHSAGGRWRSNNAMQRAGSNGGSFRSTSSQNRSFDQSSSKNEDNIKNDGRMFLERKRAGFDKLGSFEVDAEETDVDGELAVVNGDVEQEKSGGRRGEEQRSSPVTPPMGKTDNEVQSG